jgi:hypothetical protein
VIESTADAVRRAIMSFGMSSKVWTMGATPTQEDVPQDYCGEEESQVDNSSEAGGREGEGFTRGQESRKRQNSQEHLGPQELTPFKAGGEVSKPKRTSRGGSWSRHCLPASFASRAILRTCYHSYPGMSSPTAAEGNKCLGTGHHQKRCHELAARRGRQAQRSPCA